MQTGIFSPIQKIQRIPTFIVQLSQFLLLFVKHVNIIYVLAEL